MFSHGQAIWNEARTEASYLTSRLHEFKTGKNRLQCPLEFFIAENMEARRVYIKRVLERSGPRVRFHFVQSIFHKELKNNLKNYLNNSLIIYNVGNVKVKLSLGLIG
jgi:hypothetical protein